MRSSFFHEIESRRVGTIQSRAARVARAPAPTGLCPPAQGCEERATLGVGRNEPQPQRGCVSSRPTNRRNPVGVGDSLNANSEIGMGSARGSRAGLGGPPKPSCPSSNFLHRTKKLVERSFRRAAENCTPAACAPRGAARRRSEGAGMFSGSCRCGAAAAGLRHSRAPRVGLEFHGPQTFLETASA